MLTNAQMQTLKAAIVADSTLNSQPMDSNGAFVIKEALNLPSNPAVNGWRTDVPVSAIFDAIQWDKFTPVDSPDALVSYSNRILAIQTKQINLQNMLIGRESLDASKANIRAGLRDAVIGLPAGLAGAAVTAGGAGGATVLNACTRQATRAEVILTAGNATTGTVTAQLFSFQGMLSVDDVKSARES